MPSWFRSVAGQVSTAVERRPQAEPARVPAAAAGPLLASQRQATAGYWEILQGCTVNCTATVPTTAGVNASVMFQAVVDATGCTTQPTFEWNFGDGSAKSNQQNPSHTYTSAGTYQWSLTTSVNSGSTSINTVAGGYGEGNQARQATLGVPAMMARDPQGRGLYVADSIGDFVYLRFINTGLNTATIGGVTIAPGTIRVLAGGGADLSDNVSALSADLVVVTGLATNSTGDLVYLLNPIDGVVRAINVSANAVNVAGSPLAAGQIRTLASGLNSGVNGLTVNNTTGTLYFADASPGINKVYSVDGSGNVTAVAGLGGNSQATDPFNAGPALSVPLLLPRAVKIDGSGNLLIADTGHGRVIRVDSGGNATLVYQYPIGQQSPNPYPSGLAIFGGNVFTANGNQQTVGRVTGGVAVVAGQPGSSCDYSATNCGDGGPGTQAGLYMLNSTASLPLAGIEGDTAGIFISDQGTINKGRIRFLNLSGTSVTIAGVTVPAGAIDTIAGTGRPYPYDGGLATSATFSTPVGVAVDGNGNLWVADTLASLVRFVNRGTIPVTIFSGTSSAQQVPAGGIVTVNRDRNAGQTNGPVVGAGFDTPQGLFATSQGVYVVDSKGGPSVPPQTAGSRRTSFVRFINTSGSNVTFFPGSGTPIVVEPGGIARIIGGGDSGKGDGGFALSAVLVGASDIVVTSNGTIYVTDVGQKSVRKVDPNTGIISSLSLAQAQYTGLGLDSNGRLYVANYDGNSVLRENTAGGGTFSTLASSLTKARDVAVDAAGTAYVTVSPAARAAGNHQIVQVSSTGTATVIAGGNPGFSGDGGQALNARIRISPSELIVGSGTTNQLPQTVNIATGQNGEIVFTDSNNNRVRSLSPSTVICQKTGSITISGNNPVPQVTTLAPTSALQNSGAFTLTVNGSNFVPASKVRWNGQDRTTTYLSGTQLEASIPAGDLTTAGNVNITVFNPAPGGGTSNAVAFTVTAPNPVPQLTTLSPNTAQENGLAFTLTVNGTGFVSGSVIRWDGQNRTTTFVSGTQLTAQIQSSDLAGIGTAVVTVFNPLPGGGTSNSLNFSITAANNPVPTLAALNPSSATAGGVGFNLTVTGTNFVAGSKVRWNGVERTTTFVSATQLAAAIPAADIATPGTAQVTVNTPAPGGGTTAALTFTINNPVPTLATLNPSSATAGGVGFNLTVTGTNFVAGSKVSWNGVERTTTFVSATQLTAAIPAADIATPGTAQVTVNTPAPGGGTTAALTFNINNPVPTLATLNPSSAIIGSGNFNLTVTGTNFVASSKVRWNGVERTTTFVSATQLTAAIPGADIAALGTAQVTVITPAPGGGTTAALNFAINPLPPVLTSLSPNQVIAGGGDFTLTVNGTGFLSGATVRVNNNNRTTSFVSATQVTATITAADIAAAGTLNITAVNPGSAVSNTLTLRAYDRVTSVTATGYSSGDLAPESILSAFAANLATGVLINEASPLPTSLLGTRIVVKDSAGVERDQSLFFVAPQQVNYLLHPQTALGAASVTVYINNNIVALGDMQVGRISPGIFTQNATGDGVPAAYALRFPASGGYTEFPILTYDQAQTKWVPIPIDLGPATDNIYLVTYGSGYRGGTNLANIAAKLGNVDVPVIYAGIAPGYIGLDQMNLGPIPRSLIGAGAVNLTITVEGKVLNPNKVVQVNIK